MVASLWMYQSKFNFAWKEAATPRFHFWSRLDARSDPPLHNHGGCNGHTWWGKRRYTVKSWLVVSTPLKNITSSQLGWLLFLIYGKIKNVPNHQPVYRQKGYPKLPRDPNGVQNLDAVMRMCLENFQWHRLTQYFKQFDWFPYSWTRRSRNFPEHQPLAKSPILNGFNFNNVQVDCWSNTCKVSWSNSVGHQRI